MTPKAFHALFGRIGARAKMQFLVHPHMLRHGCGYALANAGHDTRALQAWLGHKNIQHTVRYTELAPEEWTERVRWLRALGNHQVPERPSANGTKATNRQLLGPTADPLRQRQAQP
jgi:integrase